MKKMWEIKQNVQEDALDLYIYGDVEGDKYDWWAEETIQSETSANAFREALAKYPNATQINLYINSYGGSVFEGTAIYNQLKRNPAHKTVYIDGFACSIASVIAMCGDEIIMPKNAMMMVHNMWMGVYGNADELRKAANDLDTINGAGRKAYLEKAGEKLSEDELARMMNEETWLTAEECIKLGLADRYSEKNADMSGAAKALQKANLKLEQHLVIRKSLAAQILEAFPPRENRSDVVEAEPEPEKQPEKNLMQMLSGILRNENKGENEK